MKFQQVLAKEALFYTKEVLFTPMEDGASVTFICKYTRELSPMFNVRFKGDGNYDISMDNVGSYTSRMVIHGLQIIANTFAKMYPNTKIEGLHPYTKDDVVNLYRKIKDIEYHKVPIFELELHQASTSRIEIVRKDDRGNDVFRYTYTEDEFIHYMVKVGNSILLKRGSPFFNIGNITNESIISLVGMYHDELLKYL